MYRWESILAIVVFPSQKLIIYNEWAYLLVCEKNCEISNSAPGQHVIALHDCCVDCPFPDHLIRCWVRTSPPPPQYGLELPI